MSVKCKKCGYVKTRMEMFRDVMCDLLFAKPVLRPAAASRASVIASMANARRIRCPNCGDEGRWVAAED